MSTWSYWVGKPSEGGECRVTLTDSETESWESGIIIDHVRGGGALNNVVTAYVIVNSFSDCNIVSIRSTGHSQCTLDVRYSRAISPSAKPI